MNPDAAQVEAARIQRLAFEKVATEQMLHAVLASPTMMELAERFADRSETFAQQLPEDNVLHQDHKTDALNYRASKVIGAAVSFARSLRAEVSAQINAEKSPLNNWNPEGGATQ